MNKVVLTYSGGLDTSVAIRWLREDYHLDVTGGTAPKQVAQALANAKKIVGQGGVLEKDYMVLATLYWVRRHLVQRLSRFNSPFIFTVAG